MDERIGRFISNQAEYSVVDEVEDFRNEIFAELQEVQEEREEELREKLENEYGLRPDVPYEGQQYPHLV